MPFETHEQNGLIWLSASVLSGVRHGFSTRLGGVSPAPWDSLNLRPGMGDGREAMLENYRRFCACLFPDVPFPYGGGTGRAYRPGAEAERGTD